MTKEEAIQEMKKGNSVNHTFFSLTEWVTMKDGKIVDELGYKSDPAEWWSYRTGKGWNTGWILIETEHLQNILNQ